MTPCNDSHENNSSEPSGRTLRHAFGKKAHLGGSRYTHIHIYTYTLIHTYTHTHIHTYTYTYTYIHIHIHIHTYTHTHTHTHTHTYTHTHTHHARRHTHTNPRLAGFPTFPLVDVSDLTFGGGVVFLFASGFVGLLDWLRESAVESEHGRLGRARQGSLKDLHVATI